MKTTGLESAADGTRTTRILRTELENKAVQNSCRLSALLMTLAFSALVLLADHLLEDRPGGQPALVWTLALGALIGVFFLLLDPVCRLSARIVEGITAERIRRAEARAAAQRLASAQGNPQMMAEITLAHIRSALACEPVAYNEEADCTFYLDDEIESARLHTRNTQDMR